jgi:hypothetical protein
VWQGRVGPGPPSATQSGWEAEVTALGRCHAWDCENAGSIVQTTVRACGGSCSRDPGASRHLPVHPMGALHWPGGDAPS